MECYVIMASKSGRLDMTNKQREEDELEGEQEGVREAGDHIVGDAVSRSSAQLSTPNGQSDSQSWPEVTTRRGPPTRPCPGT